MVAHWLMSRLQGMRRGRRLTTLHDAATFITKLPKCEHDAPEWQDAIEALMLVIEKNGPTMLARIGVVRALNRDKAGKKPRRKAAQRYRIVR
jgi:hypothetical protein